MTMNAFRSSGRWVAAAVCGAAFSVQAQFVRPNTPVPDPMEMPSRKTDETVQPELAKRLKAAQELLAAGRPGEALDILNSAAELQGLSRHERFVLEQLRGPAAAQAGDFEASAKAYDVVLASGRLAREQQLQTLQALAGAAFRAKDYGRSVNYARRALALDGAAETTRELLAQALYFGGQVGEAAAELTTLLEGMERTGRAPAESDLRLLAGCQAKLNDRPGYASTVLRLLMHHPKKAYWQDALAQLAGKPGFDDRYTLDLYRLRAAVGLSSTEDDLERAQLAQKAGQPGEALRILEAGFAAGRLGTGPQASHHQQLRDAVARQAKADARQWETELSRAQAARDGQALLQLGFARAMAGDHDKGLAAMARGLELGGLKRPDEARLHQGVALAEAALYGQAVDVLRQVHGEDGSADLARLWIAHLSRPGAGLAKTP